MTDVWINVSIFRPPVRARSHLLLFCLAPELRRASYVKDSGCVCVCMPMCAFLSLGQFMIICALKKSEILLTTAFLTLLFAQVLKSTMCRF